MPPPSPQPQIAPPFGYQAVTPLLKTHRLKLPAAGEVPEFLRRANAVPISHTEFQSVARTYPIVFTTGDEGRSYATVAVLGIAAGENLFCAADAWAGSAYVPAYARRYPFCMARVTLNQVEQKERVICVEQAAIDDAGEALFDAQGKPLEKWVGIERLLTEYEADLERSRELCAVLADYGLLEPFTMQATLNQDKGGGSLQLTGMLRVNEKNLENLNAAQLKNLLRKGFLARVYLHLLSLDNFAALLERRVARRQAA